MTDLRPSNGGSSGRLNSAVSTTRQIRLHKDVYPGASHLVRKAGLPKRQADPQSVKERRTPPRLPPQPQSEKKRQANRSAFEELLQRAAALTAISLWQAWVVCNPLLRRLQRDGRDVLLYGAESILNRIRLLPAARHMVEASRPKADLSGTTSDSGSTVERRGGKIELESDNLKRFYGGLRRF